MQRRSLAALMRQIGIIYYVGSVEIALHQRVTTRYPGTLPTWGDVQDSPAMKLKRKHGSVQLGTGTVAGSKQAATEHTRPEQFEEASHHNGSTFCARAADRTLTSKISCPASMTEHLQRACKTRRRSLSPDIRRDVQGV